jgi:hypothetical protein
LSKPSEVAPGSPTCGPFGEDTVYTTAAGQTIQGTRVGLGPDFANDDYDASIGNSNLQFLAGHLRHSPRAYNFSARIHLQQVDRSGVEHLRPDQSLQLRRDAGAFRVRSEAQFRGELRCISFRSIACPATIQSSDAGMVDFRNHARHFRFPGHAHVDGDNSLMGSIPNGVNNYSLDLPDYNGRRCN